MKDSKSIMKNIEPAPTAQIAKLSPEFLLQVFKSQELNGIINKINEEYYYWDKVKHQPVPEGIDIKQIWALIKIRRLGTPYHIKFGKYEFYWNVNSRLQGLLHFLDLNIGGTLESSSIISPTDKNRYLISSIMEEAIASSQIEGAVTTRKKAKDMLRKNIKPRNKDEQMIVNNFVSIQRILEVKKEPLTKDQLLSLHKLVTANTMTSSQEEGFLRDDNDINVIDMSTGEIVHHPPNFEEIDELLNDLIKFFNEDDPKIFIHPIVKACIVHFMVGFIHPFTDGNGRTARALFYWYLLKKQYWLTEYLSISRLILRSKAQYARAFQYSEVDGNDLTYFLSYKLRTMKLAFEELREYIKRKNEEKKKLSDFLGMDGINYRQAMILEWYSQDQTQLLTVKEVEKRLGVSNMSARNDLSGLVKKDWLTETNINKVTKGYLKSAKLDFLLNKRKDPPKKPTSQSNDQAKLF